MGNIVTMVFAFLMNKIMLLWMPEHKHRLQTLSISSLPPQMTAVPPSNGKPSLSEALSTTDGDTTDLRVTLSSSIDGDLEVTFDASTGLVSGQVTLSSGNHLLKLLAVRGEESDVAGVNITVCDYEIDEDFSTPPDSTNWRIFGDAMHVADGYLEMTNNQPNKHGKIYNIAQRVNPGALEASFKVYTGPNDANGADGFTMTIVDAPSFTALEKILGCSGGMGNAFSPNMPDCTMTVDELAATNSFTIEFDTFPNGWLCNHPQNGPTDPTCEDHVASISMGAGCLIFWLPAGWGDYEACTGPANDECKAALDCIEGICKPIWPWLDREFSRLWTTVRRCPPFLVRNEQY